MFENGDIIKCQESSTEPEKSECKTADLYRMVYFQSQLTNCRSGTIESQDLIVITLPPYNLCNILIMHGSCNLVLGHFNKMAVLLMWDEVCFAISGGRVRGQTANGAPGVANTSTYFHSYI